MLFFRKDNEIPAIKLLVTETLFSKEKSWRTWAAIILSWFLSWKSFVQWLCGDQPALSSFPLIYLQKVWAEIGSQLVVWQISISQGCVAWSVLTTAYKSFLPCYSGTQWDENRFCAVSQEKVAVEAPWWAPHPLFVPEGNFGLLSLYGISLSFQGVIYKML